MHWGEARDVVASERHPWELCGMATYDPSVIGTMADHMYARASTQVVRYSIVGIVLGLVLGYIAGVFAYRQLHSDDYSLIIAAVLGLLGGIEGFAMGRSAALVLRFQAQQALVMAEIERNTRRAEDAPDPVVEDRRIELTR